MFRISAIIFAVLVLIGAPSVTTRQHATRSVSDRVGREIAIRSALIEAGTCQLANRWHRLGRPFTYGDRQAARTSPSRRARLCPTRTQHGPARRRGGSVVRGRGPRNAYFRRSGTEGLPCTVRRRSDGFLKKIRSAWHPEKHRTPIPRYLAKPCYYGLLLFARNISESAHKS